MAGLAFSGGSFPPSELWRMTTSELLMWSELGNKVYEKIQR